MEQSNAQNFIEEYQLALDTTPEEVRNFLWSDAYKNTVTTIAETFDLTPEQTTVVSDVLFDLTINATDEIHARTTLTRAGISDEKQAGVFEAGYQYVISPSITEVEEVSKIESSTDSSDGDNTSSPTTAYSARSETLTNLAARLTNPTSIAPTKRDYSITNTEVGGTQINSTTPAPKTFDPYREAPEK